MPSTPRPRLGELLLAKGVCSRERLREAWEQKVLYGDRLGTNLLSLGYIDEHTLVNTLGQQLGVHSGYGRVISPDKNAIKLVPKAVAIKRFVVPHHVVDKQLFLMMRDPLDALALEEASFASNLRITPVVVCEARIWQLLEVHYHTVMSLRPVPLDGIVHMGESSLEDATASTIALLGPELTSEDEFQRLYAGIHRATPVENPAQSDELVPPPVTPEPVQAPAAMDPNAMLDKTSPARPIAIGKGGFLAPPKTGPGEENEWRDTIEKTQPMMAKPRFTTSEQGEPEPIIDLVEVTDSFSPAMLEELRKQKPAPVQMEPPLVRQSTADFHVEIQPAVDESPLSFADATKLLQTATDRTAIARIVLRAARTRFKRACLLAVYPDRVLGWMGIGDGMDMRDVVVKRNEKSVFALVADSRSHYLGPLGRMPVHGAWVKATGRQIPKSIAVFPILVRGRPVNLLFVDNGHDQHVGSDVGEVLILAQQIAKTYETLLTSS